MFGVDVVGAPMQVRRLLGYVPQQLSIDGQLTGFENVTLFARLFDVPRANDGPGSWTPCRSSDSTMSAIAWPRRIREA